MKIPITIHGPFQRVLYAVSVFGLAIVVVLQCVQALASQSLTALNVLSCILTLGAVSGPVARYLGNRSFLRIHGGHTSTGIANYWIRRIASLLLLTAIAYFAGRGVLFLLLLRVAPMPGQIDIGILIAIVMSSVLVNFAVWVSVHLVINIVDPKPSIDAKLRRSELSQMSNTMPRQIEADRSRMST